MRKRWSGIWYISAGKEWRSLLVLGAAFAVGGLLGSLMASLIAGAGTDGLMDYIQSFFSAAQKNYTTSPALLSLLWEQFRYPIAVLLLSFTALGTIAIPGLFAMRSFFLSFAISSFARMFGGDGVILSAVLFGLSGVISVPVLFALGTQGWENSRRLAGHGEKIRHGREDKGFLHAYFPRIASCVLWILLCVLVEHFCTLQLLIWTVNVLGR